MAKGGGLSFSEEELAYMQARVRGTTVTAGVGSKARPNSDSTREKKQSKTAVKKDVGMSPTPTAEDPDWTAPRTVKTKRVRGGKTVNQHIAEVILSIKEAVVKTSVSSEHLTMYFEGARLLTLNEILAIFPYQPYLIFNYKKAWANKIDEALLLARDSAKCDMPEFTHSCVFVGFRRSTQLMDRDGLSSCFKYILDNIRNQIVLGKTQVLKDDNPNLIVETPCYQVKGPHAVGVRLERVLDWKEPAVNEALMLSSSPMKTW
jgi:hypothetical protein